MTADNIEEIFELSALQQGILFHSVHDPHSGVYVVQMECSLDGPLESASFARAWQRLVDAYTMLRTSFVWENVARPLQVVQTRVAFKLLQHDLTSLSADDQEAGIHRYIEEDRRRGFNLAHAPLMRAALFRVGAGAYRFVWTHHHILLDGWSVGLVLKAVLQLYGAELQGAPSPVLPSLPFSAYVDWLDQQDASRAKAFWRGRLRGFARPTRLGVAQASAAHGRVGEHRICLSELETAELTAAARLHRLTLATVVQAAWGLLLSRYSGEDEVVFGSTVSTRPPDRQGFESLVGPCINTLPVRLAVEPSLGVVPWLTALRNELVEAMPHCHADLMDIQRSSEIPRDAPLFESIIAVENYPADRSLRRQGSGLDVHAVRWIGSTNYPLAVMILPEAEITVVLQYDESRFAGDAVMRMLVHYRELLRGISRGMEGAVGSLPMLTEAERRQMLVDWNATGAPLPHEAGINELFEAQVRGQPKAVAVVDGQAEHTYEELNHRANQLARYLQERGIGVGSLVGIFSDRCFDLLIALLGVWKAGAACVPLDPSHPKERTAFMLSDANVSWVLTGQRVFSQLPRALTGVIRLDTDWPLISRESADDLARTVMPEGLAYVLYTSGSTGTPKGVMVPHRGLLNYLAWCVRAYSVEQGRGAPVHTSIAFDLTLTAILAPLVAGKGATLLPEDRGVGALAAALHKGSRSQAFSLVKLTPSHIRLLGVEGVPGSLKHGTRAFVVGGEELNADHVAALHSVAPGAAIFNEYGPTETVVGCCVYQVPENWSGAGPIPIGRPIDNTQLYILDRHWSPVPIGVAGELWIGGTGLAHGYLGRPDLTAERFVPNPFDGERGGCLYRTGDRARYLPDGNIEFLGRRDRQLKIRGFRIEPAEIEEALGSHPAVREAAVVVRKGADGETELVACWAPRCAGEEPAAAELRRFLLRKLPESMVPAFFAAFERLPLTSNGKIDRAALAVTPAAVPDMSSGYVAPRTPVEEGLAGIWCEVLGLTRVGIHDDFFELGGHSLSVLRVRSRVRTRFDVELSLERLFEARTIATLGGIVESARQRPADLEESIPRRPGGQDASPASFFQQRLWLLDQLYPGSPVYNVNAAVRIEGPLDVPILEQSLKQVILRHEILRTAFAMREGRIVQLIAPASGVSLKVKQRPLTGPSTVVRRKQAQAQLAQWAQEPFDLATSPLLRVCLLSIDEREHMLLLSMHHIVSDGWSRNVLVREVAAFYQAGLSGAQASLPELLVQYADFSIWQRARAEGVAGAAQLDYWKRQLASLTPFELPADRRRPPRQSFRGAQHPFTLSLSLSRAIEAFSRENSVTAFVALLAGFVALLYRVTAANDIAVGSPIANRSRAETENLIGPCINTVVLRCRIDKDSTFLELVNQVQEVVLAAQAHQEAPFEQVVTEFDGNRDESRNPLFQVLFDLQHAPEEWARLPGLRLVPMDIDGGTAKVDLALHIWNVADGFHGLFEYSTDLFDESRIARMAAHFQRLLESAVGGDRRPLADLPMLSGHERRDVLFDWNDTRRDCAQDICLHQLFEEQVKRTPDGIAVVFEETRITYRELNRRANGLAHHLVALGVRPETLVGVHLDRSVELVVALMGILKAGGAYLPLSPSLPSDRLALMIRDSGISLLLTRRGSGVLAPHLDRVHLDDSAVIQAQCDGDARSAIRPGGLAYVMYTSGSTGRPKGVMIQHDGICNRLLWMQDAYRLTAADRVLQKTPLGFDVSVWEFFWALISGSCLVLAQPGRHGDVAYLAGVIVSEKITTLHFVPSLLHAMVEEPRFGDCTSLERVFCSGEALSHELAERFSERSRASLYNLYGPTEASVDVTAWTWQRGAPRVLIGRPIANLRAHILGPRQELLPVGVPGELYLGGVGLARGYLGQPTLTADRFVPDPFSEAGERLYRTGDRCQYLEGGEIEFLGRLDDQLKIRGVRVEPGEIEAELVRHPGVEECVVVARDDQAAGARLFAYVVLRRGHSPSADELRRHVGHALPEAMIPAAFIAIDAFPLTPNGKADRRALPEPTGERPSLDEWYVPPETPEELALAEIWSRVLDVNRIGVHDNFFSLGGDSVRSIQVVSLARERGISISLQRLFREPTIRALAIGTPDEALLARPSAFELLRLEDRARVPAGLEDAYPLTALQLGMVFHDAYDPAAQLYRNVDSIHMGAHFDPEFLVEAAQRLVDRHEILRTSFDLIGYTEAVQLVHQTVKVSVSIEDLRNLSHSAQEANLAEWLERQRDAPIDITVAPLFRFYVHRRAEKTFQLTLVHHHAILDGWSVGALFAELMGDYLASLRAERLAPSPIAAAFRDYVFLERSTLEAPMYRQYWEKHTLGTAAPRLLPFPDAGTPEQHDATRHRELHIDLGESLSAAIGRLASSAAVSRKSVLLAAHVRVLGLLGGQSEVVTGVVTDGRPELPGGERVLGLFLNSTPFRIGLPGGTWMELVREVFAYERASSPFRRFPLAYMERDLGGRSLLDTVFNYTHFHVLEPLSELEGVHILDRHSFARSSFRFVANFDVAASADRRLTLTLAYDAANLGGEQAETIGELYRRALGAMTSRRSGRYESDYHHSPEDRRVLLELGNDTQTAYPRDACIHRLFEAQARRTPGAPALVCGDDWVSYEEFDRRANRLARRLQSLGVGPEMRVGVCLERSFDLIVGILAILKAGGAYVPLDPAYPEERLAFMLGDSDAAVVLAHRRFAGRLASAGRLVVFIEETPGDDGEPLAPVDDGGITAESLAYVMYTSGSTGQPKGVCIPHRGVVRLVLGVDYVDLGSNDVVLQAASIAFDASTFEIWGALLNGALLALLPAHKPSMAELAAEIGRHGVTTMLLTSTVFNLVVDAHLDSLRCVRLMLVGGDVVSPARALVVARTHPGCRVINGYGPTESTTFACCWPLLHPERDLLSVPIGPAIANTRVYVCDGQLEPVPIGVPGELYIGGDGLARGYLNRPDLTAERFVPDPFSDDGGGRLYRTGDLVRRLPTGDIEFLRRVGRQVKIRGIRVELDETEVVLRGHPAVREAVVELRGGTPGGDGCLTAYVVFHAGNDCPSSELRSFLARKLPEPNVPSAYVALDQLPLSPTGKLNRSALPEPDRVRPELRPGYIAPRTAFEEIVADIWSELLGVEHPSVHDNFLELGGNSLIATQVISRIRDRLQTDLPLRAAFDAPTISELAVATEASRREANRVCAAPITAIRRDKSALLSVAQEQVFELHLLLRGLPLFNMPARVLLKGLLDAPALAYSLQEVVARHESLRTTFDVIDGHATQVIAPASSVELTMMDLRVIPSAERAAEAERLAHADASRPFDLAHGPLLRAGLLQLEDDEHVLLLTMHHIISDGWSMGVLMREIVAVYGSLLLETPMALPQMSVQFADFAAWQLDRLRRGGYEAELSYWKRELAPPFQRLEFAGGARPEGLAGHLTSSAPVVLGAPLLAMLRIMAREQGVSLFMVLLAAFDVFLFRATGLRDIRIGTLLANRTSRETEDLIGLFINTVVLRADLTGDPTFREILHASRDKTLAAYDHQDVPFEIVIQSLAGESEFDRSAIFQAMLILQNAPMPRLSIPGLEFEPWRANAATPFVMTGVDLSLVFDEDIDGLKGSLIYRAGLFDAEAVAEMQSSFEKLLAGVAAHLDMRLSEL